MAQAKTWVAFDVHVGGVVAATFEQGSGELRGRVGSVEPGWV